MSPMDDRWCVGHSGLRCPELCCGLFLREVPAIARAIEKYEVPLNERGGGTDVGRPESGTYEARRAPLPTGRPCGAPSCGDREHSAGPEKAIGLERLVGDVDVCDAG